MHLSLKECALIMDNCFSGLFVTDGTGRIIYVNHDTLDTLGVSASEILGMDVYQLQDLGFTSNSSTADALKSGKRIIGTYRNKAGKSVATVSTPVFDDEQQILMVVTYSSELSSLEDFQEELSRINRKLQKYEAAKDYLESNGQPPLVSEDPAMQYIFSLLDTISDTDSTVMLYGESGVGKEVIANYIYQHSHHKSEVFVPINCAAIPENLIEAELFGYEKGAFTGADSHGKAGIFELANGGTIFMDEIGELPLAAQTKLLRVLESGEYRRIGGKAAQTADVRIIGATNRDLKKMIAEKKFRADLYYRLNVIPITIPPLRKRPADLDAFVALFLRKFNRKHGKNRTITPAVIDAMHRYSWPGNIRELRNVIEQYVLTGSESVFLFDEDDRLLFSENGGTHTISASFMQEAVEEMLPLKDVCAQLEEQYIRTVLQKCNANVSKAARLLGISRATLYEKLKKHSHDPLEKR